MKKLRLGAICAVLFWAGACSAQQPFLEDSERPAYGVYGDVNINWHTADFRALPGVPNCCPDFQSGSGVGAAFGVLYERPFSRKFALQLRAGYSWDGATLTSTEGTTVIVNNAAIPGEFQHTVNANIATFGLEPYLKFNAGRFSLQVGFRAGFVITKTYDQKEEIVQPADEGTFNNGQRTRNVYSGDIPNATGFHIGIMSGVSYEFPMNKSHTMFAAPEVQLGLGVSPMVSGLTWNSNVVRLGVAIKYIPNDDDTPLNTSETTTEETTTAPSPTPEPKPVAAPPAPVPPMPPPATMLTASVKAVGVDSNGGVHPDVAIRLEQFRSLQIRPLLNYIFFDQDSSSLSRRYVRLTSDEANEFSIDKLHNVATLPLYYQILNIVGKRMRDNPNAVITVTGCNDNAGNEKENTYLSRMRAETVRDYLATVWNISYERMKVEARDLPADSSDISSPDGVQENRRVEINSDDWAIVQPVITRDTVVQVSPEAIRFRTNVIAPSGVTAWALRATEGDSDVVKEFSGESAVPAILEWPLDRNQFERSRMALPIKYSLNVQDSTGKSVTTPDDSINVNFITIDKKHGTRVADKEIDHYSLILYKFDKSDLSLTNQRIVKMVKEFITPDASVSVTGYTDRMGDPAHNKDLSLSRAQVAAEALGLTDDKTQGVGQTDMYNNNLPEGRFYCRTVDIVVERPVKD